KVTGQADLAQQGVPGRTGDDGEQVGRGIFDQTSKLRAVSAEALDRLVELTPGRGCVGRGPGTFGPGFFPVGRVGNVLEQVALDEPEVLEQVVRRVPDIRRPLIHRRGRKLDYGLVVRHVG